LRGIFDENILVCNYGPEHRESGRVKFRFYNNLRNNDTLDGDGAVVHWSDTWQLIINTVTNIVSMLMVFLIQNTQNRESSALQLKIDELLRAVQGAQNTFIDLEDLNEDDLSRLKERYVAIALRARRESTLPSKKVEPASGTAPTSPE
jgi:low affinity Fe/Cu permease